MERSSLWGTYDAHEAERQIQSALFNPGTYHTVAIYSRLCQGRSRKIR